MTLRIGQRVRVIGSETIGIIRQLETAADSPIGEARALLEIGFYSSGLTPVFTWERQQDLLTEPPTSGTVKARDDA